ncbi:hypothetical protein L916_17161 [Phytophthora nicotianae]|uniref:Uncharacterized protein n=1 Tax=Phytophthora nicotianae TaxID=4792 RepID=W2I8M4_PHYNI|nr:hypothetical protein L916_17161 [Phytophthora nicotianae]
MTRLANVNLCSMHFYRMKGVRHFKKGASLMKSTRRSMCTTLATIVR